MKHLMQSQLLLMFSLFLLLHFKEAVEHVQVSVSGGCRVQSAEGNMMLTFAVVPMVLI